MQVQDVLSNAKRASRFLKALANDNRLVILCALVDSEKSVGELEQILGIRQPTLSQQLARLRADKMVSTRRESKQIFYRLASEEAEKMIGLLYELFCSQGMEEGQTCGAGSDSDAVSGGKIDDEEAEAA